MIREIISLLAIVLAVTVALVAMRSEREVREQMFWMERPAARAYAQDRLTGSSIDVASLVPPGSQPMHFGRRSVVLWLLDMERCPECFDNLGPWSRLETLEGHDFLLVFVGEPSATVKGRLRSLRRTRVFQTTREQAAATVGAVLANTKFLLDEDGIAVLADSRESAAECGWSFEAQVGALKGLNSSRAIRGTVSSSPEEGEHS